MWPSGRMRTLPGFRSAWMMRSVRAARHLETVRLFEERGELDRDVERALPRQRPARERVEQVFARHVLHHHVEAAARFGDLVDERHQPVMTREFLLQLRAAALRVGNRAVAGIGADRDQLQRAQFALAVLARGVDRGASARADHRLQHVVAQDPVQIRCSLMHGVTGACAAASRREDVRPRLRQHDIRFAEARDLIGAEAAHALRRLAA